MQAQQTSPAVKPALAHDASTPNVCPFADQANVPRLRPATGVDRFAALFLSLARFVGADGGATPRDIRLIGERARVRRRCITRKRGFGFCRNLLRLHRQCP